jgi:hypothetical protein
MKPVRNLLGFCSVRKLLKRRGLTMNVREHIEDEISRIDFRKEDDVPFTALRTIHRLAIHHLPDLERVALERMSPDPDYWDPWLHALALTGGKRRLSQSAVREILPRARSYSPGSDMFKLFSFTLERQRPPMEDLALDQEMLHLVRDVKPQPDAEFPEVDNPYYLRDQFERYFCCLDLASTGTLVVPPDIIEPATEKLARMGYVGDLRERFVLSTILWIPGSFAAHPADGSPLSPDPKWGANPERFWTFDLLREGAPLDFKALSSMHEGFIGWPGVEVVTQWRRERDLLRLKSVDIEFLPAN